MEELWEHCLFRCAKREIRYCNQFSRSDRNGRSRDNRIREQPNKKPDAEGGRRLIGDSNTNKNQADPLCRVTGRE